MRTIWQSLAWKEWHEHKWQLAAITAVLCGVAALTLKVASHEPRTLDTVSGMLIACVAPLALFIGLTVAAGDRSRGTLPFLQSLPVPMWRVALHKFLAGLATLAVAVVITLTLLYLGCLGLKLSGINYLTRFSHVSPMTTLDWFGETALLPIAIAASLYIWTAACGANRRDEVSAGAVVAVVLVGSWTLLVLIVHLVYVSSGDYPGPLARAFGVGIAPLGFLAVLNVAGNHVAAAWLGMASAIVVHLALATWYVWRYGRVASLEIRSRRPAASEAGRPDWLAPPRRSPMTAIVWKQLRESMPVVLVGLLCIGGGALIRLMFDWQQYTQSDEFVVLVFGMSATFGVFITVVFGIATFFYDVEPRPNEFWRSRPINPNQWFWVKFLTGMTTAVVTLGLLPISVALLVHSTGGLERGSDAIILAPVYFALFAGPVAMMCLVRQAVYAAVLGIATAFLGVLLFWLVLWAAALAGWDNWGSTYPGAMSVEQVAAGLIVSFFVSTLLGWLAVRRDWGWKR